MKILLINPENPPSAGRDLYTGEIMTMFSRLKPFSKCYFGLPLALPTLAGLTPAKHKVRIIDEHVERINFDEDCDLVGITAMTFKAKRAYQIAAEFRRRGKTVIMGGIHATVAPDDVAPYVDCVVVGEADELWPKVLEDFENGVLQPRYDMKTLPDIAKLPPPNHAVYKYRRYSEIYLQTARGCPFHCSFCTVTTISGRKMRLKTPEQVVNEVDSIIKLRPMNKMWMKKSRDGKWTRFVGEVFFVDDNFAIDRKHALAVSAALKEYQLKNRVLVEWFTQVNFMVGLDDELLTAMSDASCRVLFMGFESLDPAALKKINKGMNNPDKYKESIANVRRHGMDVVFSTILGGDFDTLQTGERVADFVEENNLFFVLPNILTPYPGTRLFDEMKRDGRLLTDDTDQYNIRNVVFKPKNMSPEQLQRIYTDLCSRIFRFDSLVERGMKTHAKLTPFSRRINFVERTAVLFLFTAVTLVMALRRKVTWRVAGQIFRHMPLYFMKRGTLESLFWVFGIGADYDHFAKSERNRFENMYPSNELANGPTETEFKKAEGF